MNANRKAFLDMIAHSEGTSTCKATRHNGYDVIVGGTVFTDFSDHPRKLVQLNTRLKSTAAGRYQLLMRYWDVYKKQLKLPDFSPASQDAVAIQQIREQKALADVDAGRFEVAVAKCANIWASFPGAGYGQHENTLAALQKAYVEAGGVVA
ncbi:glycoside hydrolase family 24 protein [Methylomonas rapida]|uniref:Glycoside hydrolase family 104 protein n=1 Tax=Methylomonas rapida TaxID=2963939 RepID=A0ABY7GLX9_9GAMM|nr:glycoside hydrolase family 104 protein [Methylomonas rapida]WAR43628.1 glycoside hydrolase family 104 protein [Methylomonas rapida]WAR45502.1 glycoside hydrolase family 104 protein [Methylomonas rapida]